MISWLSRGAPFPPVEAALSHPNGLLAASADLPVDRLIDAYRHGIFPWYSAGEPVLWWSPDPRMVLAPSEFRASRSLRKRLRAAARSETDDLVVDRAFAEVIHGCAAPRPGQDGTWITPAVLAGYGELAARGLAHSVELWRGGRLAGGLYGVALGRMFYGESMFSRAPDASKIALATLVEVLLREGVAVIDCQQNTAHLASMGGREIARSEFCAHVAGSIGQPPIDWHRYRGMRLNRLLEKY
ncbi:MAG TPA: leucyl/phenylalanyl-tRNA--protein transferase [Burkholderiaceae bacterium]